MPSVALEQRPWFNNHLESQWWRTFAAPFIYTNTGYAFVSLFAIGLFGWLLERRHGPLVVVVLFLLGGIGGLAATAGGRWRRFALATGASSRRI